MTQWAKHPEHRDQMLLYAKQLDQAIAPDHPVRLFDEILANVSWSAWEAHYDRRQGQPAIHPRVMASILLYGLLTRIRSSRALEDALQVRLDFRWLAHGFQIDHTTLSEFRRKHAEPLKDLFRQIGLLAKTLGVMSLQRVCFDGTRIRANSRRGSTRTPEELRREKEELDRKFQEHLQKAESEDTRDEEQFAASEETERAIDPKDLKNRRARVRAALAELEKLEQTGATIPSRIPLTDPESRVMPNKEGGCAPNYTPVVTVDAASGLILEADVLNVHNEDAQLVPALREVQAAFALPTLPPEVLMDGLNATGANLAQCEELGVTAYAPVPLPDPKNPAVRADPTQPVPEVKWPDLPTHKTPEGPRLDKSAFVYCEAENCYRCPLGKAMPHVATTSEASGSGRRIRDRYKAAKEDCAACPLKAQCLHGKNAQRQINREQFEKHRDRQAERMSRPESQEIYALRRHPGERPFAVIKQAFGMRQFLLRGHERVRVEFRWASLAFNLQRLMSLLRSRAGPDGLIKLSTS